MRRHCALAPLVCRHLSQRARRTHRLASSSGAKARQTSQAHASRRHCAPAGGGGVRRTPARPVSRTPAPPPYLQVVPCRHKQKGDARVAQARARAAQRDVQVAHQPEVETRVPAAPKALRWGGTAERRLRGGGGGMRVLVGVAEPHLDVIVVRKAAAHVLRGVHAVYQRRQPGGARRIQPQACTYARGRARPCTLARLKNRQIVANLSHMKQSTHSPVRTARRGVRRAAAPPPVEHRCGRAHQSLGGRRLGRAAGTQCRCDTWQCC